MNVQPEDFKSQYTKKQASEYVTRALVVSEGHDWSPVYYCVWGRWILLLESKVLG